MANQGTWWDVDVSLVMELMEAVCRADGIFSQMYGGSGKYTKIGINYGGRYTNRSWETATRGNEILQEEIAIAKAKKAY